MHRSVDGVKIINYAQWEKAEDMMNAGRNPAVGPFMARLAGLYKVEPHVYDVILIDNKVEG